MTQDITGRKQSERHLTLLAAATNHRAMNMLAIVQAILRQTRAESVGDYAKAAQARIAVLARTYARLSEGQFDCADLRRLVEEEDALWASIGDLCRQCTASCRFVGFTA